jgi:predicted RNase H-like HicB family nuclease
MLRNSFCALRRISIAAAVFGVVIQAHAGGGYNGDGGGGSVGVNGGGHAPPSGSSGGPGLLTNLGVTDEGAAVKSVTRAAEAAISKCPEDNPLCVADALDAYADALRNLSPPLPPDLQTLPDVVSRAARRVRQAKTKAQAVKAIKIAIAEVHKTISLLKADDPVVLKAETRQGDFVAETLEVADNKLEKAVGL